MRIHFIAIGGAAMHNLAIALSTKDGYIVTGSDDEIFDPAKSHLEEYGLLPDQIGWHTERITPDLDAVILGMHAREDNAELIRAKELGIPIYSFPEYLYEQTKDKIRIVVGGSHGKTTTTAMILHSLQQLGIESDYMVGAGIANFDRMVRLSDTAKVAVFEGDEYLTSPLDHRSKFLLYHPNIAILTGIAWDHINVFPTFEEYVETFRKFVGLIEPNGEFIYFEGDANLCKLADDARTDIKRHPYKTLPYKVKNSVVCLEYPEELPLRIFGEHNLQNMHAAAIAIERLVAMLKIDISKKQIYEALSSFGGAKNRLEKIFDNNNLVVFKDFAHSPSKLLATVHAVRQQYPKKRLVACMELHTFSSLMSDFLPHYKGCMKEADTAFVYYNPEVVAHKKLATITPEQVEEGFGGGVEVFTDSKQLKSRLEQLDYSNTVLLLMSSGTFDGLQFNEIFER